MSTQAYPLDWPVGWKRSISRRRASFSSFKRQLSVNDGISRAIERHGGAEILDRAFTGFVALPAPEQPFQVLGVSAQASRAEIETAYRRLASEHHPDRGGDAQQMARINAARDALLERFA